MATKKKTTKKATKKKAKTKVVKAPKVKAKPGRPKVVGPPKLKPGQIEVLKRVAAALAPIDVTAFDQRTLRGLTHRKLIAVKHGKVSVTEAGKTLVGAG